MTSLSMLDNLVPFLIIFTVFVVGALFISSFYVFPCMRKKIAEFIKNYIGKMRWNGVMRAITVSFLKICVGLSIYF